MWCRIARESTIARHPRAVRADGKPGSRNYGKLSWGAGPLLTSTLTPWKTAWADVSTGGVWYRNKSSSKNMEQKPHKEASEDIAVPEPPATPPPEDPAPVMRPEDEALVAERLRELGYIE
jgi:hypothetical protein